MRLQNSLYTVTDQQHSELSHDYWLHLDAAHCIYQAHFPGQPITPGVCIMQIALELMELAAGHRLSLTSAKNVKFLRIIAPNEVPDLCYSIQKLSAEEQVVKAQIVVSHEQNIYAKLSLTCQIKR